MSKHWMKLVASLLALSLIAAACGDDDDGADSTEPEPTTDAAADGGEEGETDGGEEGETDGGEEGETDGGEEGEAGETTAGFVEGCDEGSVTDPTIIDPSREVARCEPGFPAPQPLDETETVVVSSAFRLEFNSPLLLAISQGEFEKENLEIEFVDVGYSDAVPQMASGDIDVAVGGIEIALFNAGNLDLPVKVIMGNYYPPDAGNYDVPQTGLWCRRDAFSDPENPDLAEIPGLTWSSSVGKGSVSVYYSVSEIERQLGEEIDISDTVIEGIRSADALTALQNNGVQCAVILDPLWLELADDDQYFLAASQTPGEPLGQYSFGSRMFENREVGLAFTRAFLRTINTYFQDDYHADDEVMALISEEIDQPVDQLRLVPSLVMDWEMREGTTTRVQELFIDTGTITDFAEPVSEDQLVDRSFYYEVVTGSPDSPFG